MSFIEFSNGMRVECPDTVRAVDGIVRMPEATITLNGQQYVARDVVIDFTENTLSYPTVGEERTTWRTDNA